MKTKKGNPNIVFIGRYNSSEQLSGPEKVARRIFTEHSKNNKTYFIQYFFDGRVYGLYQKLFGITEEQINDNSVLYTVGLFKIYGLLKQVKPDIIHIIMFERFAVIAILYKFFNNVKTIYNEHGLAAFGNFELKKTSYIYKLKDKLCEKTLLKNSDKVIFVSEQAIDIAEMYYAIDKSKCVILANGIDSSFNENTNNKDYTIKPRVVFMYLNELYKSGFEFLQKYLNEFSPQMELFIISGPDLNLNLNANIIKPMPVNELVEFYKDKHLFLALNKYDTFSISTAEAMAAGLIPIVTIETGISRYIENNMNGYLIPYGETKILNLAIHEYLCNPSEKKVELSKNVRLIYESLNWNDVYSSYKNIYMELA